MSFEHIDGESLVPYAAEVGLLGAAHAYNAFILREAGVLETAQPYYDTLYREARWANEADDQYETNQEIYQITDADNNRISLRSWGSSSGSSLVETVALCLTTSHIEPTLREIKDKHVHAPVAVIHSNASGEIIERKLNFTPEQAVLVAGMAKGLRAARDMGLLTGMISDLSSISTYNNTPVPIRRKPTGGQL